MNANTPGKRLYLIRLACGDGVRSAEPLKRFAARVKRETGATYHANALSLLERDEQGWRLADVDALWRVDPSKRGRVWLAFGEVLGAAPGMTDAELKDVESSAGGPSVQQKQAVGDPTPVTPIASARGGLGASHASAAGAKRARRSRRSDRK